MFVYVVDSWIKWGVKRTIGYFKISFSVKNFSKQKPPFCILWLKGCKREENVNLVRVLFSFSTLSFLIIPNWMCSQEIIN